MLKLKKHKLKQKIVYCKKYLMTFFFFPKNLSIISTDVSILLLENNLNVPHTHTHMFN